MRRILLGLAAAGALGAVGVLLVRFVWPGVSSEVELGPVEAFPVGSVTSFYIPPGEESWGEYDGRDVLGGGCMVVPGVVIHLVRLTEDTMIAFSGRSSHLGERVLWFPDQLYNGYDGVFMEPCHIERWAIDGTRIFGPAPRNLDRYELWIEDGRVMVDTQDLTLGAR